MVFVVSGGWFSSKRFIWPRRYGELLARGLTVFAVVHGSQPKYAIDEIAPQIHRAVRFVRHHAKEYGVAPDRLGILGMSSGGHLALLIALSGKPGDPDAADPVDKESSRVQAVAAFFPPTDFLNYGREGRDVQDLAIRKQFEAPFTFYRVDPKTGARVKITDRQEIDAKLKEISPITHVDARDPPVLLLHGDRDRLVPLQQSRRLKKRLEQAGVETKLIVKEDAGHAWRGMESDRALVAAWLDTRLAKKK